MNVRVLHVEECPNTAALLNSLDAVLRDRSVTIASRVVRSIEEADALGMHGSPTLQIDGRDPFVASPEPSLSCRLYRTEAGLRGLPSIPQLRAVFVRNRRSAAEAEAAES